MTKLEQMQAIPIDPTLQCWSAPLAARFLLVRSVYGQGGNSEIYIFERLTMTCGYQPLLRKLDEKLATMPVVLSRYPFNHRRRPALGCLRLVDVSIMVAIALAPHLAFLIIYAWADFERISRGR
ncbi:hypothetical protein LT40_07250 [Pseudomonas rhizosphaerae]|uniref:Uncharacterized protein n=1 Tax=Pseudomonas rhizosphaerae TaxID=216142 RepID=A0A089ZQ89_9PSED|nr:hypothetical protein LT40_07250 [Pseudomonas rhizosphaerae]